VAHVEAGLRSGDKWQPFPEEINRRITTLLADLHFAPTENARRNLLKAGVAEDRILVTGNPGIDALRWALQHAPSPETAALLNRLSKGTSGKDLQETQFSREQIKTKRPTPKLILVTAHRRESFGQPLENVCVALRAIAGASKDKAQIVFLVHPNPNVSDLVRRMLSDVPGITLLSPLDYISMAHLLNISDLIVTDSGGLQEEATSLGKPILVIREVTDRPESVEVWTARIVGLEGETIRKHIATLIEDETAYQAMAQAENVYGDGRASEKIIEALIGKGMRDE